MDVKNNIMKTSEQKSKVPPYYMAGPSITELEISCVMDAVKNGWYENAYYYVEKFEKEFAAYHDRKYCLMTPNCTSAIHLLLAGLGISDNDEVIVPECTWIASVSPLKLCRATPVFADIDPLTWCIDPSSIEKRITPKTKAIIAVDLYGNMPDMKRIYEICEKYNLYLIEDAAEALGSVLNGRKAGKFGSGSVFSFHRTKTICTGEGGALLLDEDELYERCKILRDHGRKAGGPAYYNYEIAFKYMPFNIQAALAYAQLQRIEELINIKRELLNSYKDKLRDIPDILFNPEPQGGRNGAWVTALVFGESHKITKKEAMEWFESQGMPSRPFFYPLTSLPAFSEYTEKYANLNPVSHSISNRGINLSCSMNLTEDAIDLQCNAIRSLVNSKRIYSV